MRTLVHARKDIASALLALTVLAGTASALSACNTFAGFGEDMAAAGHAVANSAEKLKGE